MADVVQTVVGMIGKYTKKIKSVKIKKEENGFKF